MAGNFKSGAQLALLAIGGEMRDRQGRHGIHQMWVKDSEQSGGDLREFSVEPALDARREEREGFEQALDLRISAIVRRKLQPSREFGIALGKCRSHPAQ